MKNIKKLAIIIFSIAPFISFAQPKNTSVNLQGGAYQYDFRNDIKTGQSFAVELSYRFKKRFVLSYHSAFGSNTYMERDFLRTNSKDLNFAIRSNKTNADISTIHIGGLIAYSVPITHKVFYTTHIGVTALFETIKYPQLVIGSSKRLIKSETKTLLAIPVKLQLGYMYTKRLEIAFVGGCYVNPLAATEKEYAIGIYAGPQICYRF